MRAAMRKPSSLISWSHCGPDGAISTGWQSWGGIQRESGEGASCKYIPRQYNNSLHRLQPRLQSAPPLAGKGRKRTLRRWIGIRVIATTRQKLRPVVAGDFLIISRLEADALPDVSVFRVFVIHVVRLQ